MDINRLYFRHQLSVMRASAAGNCHARIGHQSDARGLAGRIAALQHDLGASAARAWHQECAR